MPVRVIVSIEALPGKGAELIRMRVPWHAEVRKEPGCEQFDLFQDTEDPDKLLLVERWTDEASLAAHGERNRERPPIGADLRAGPSKAERFVIE